MAQTPKGKRVTGLMPGTAMRNNTYRRGNESPDNASLLIATVLRRNVLPVGLRAHGYRGAGLGQAGHIIQIHTRPPAAIVRRLKRQALCFNYRTGVFGYGNNPTKLRLSCITSSFSYIISRLSLSQPRV